MAGTRNYQSIGEVLVAVKTEFPDITISKIRFLESEGLIEPERTPSGLSEVLCRGRRAAASILRMQRDEYLPLKVIKERLLQEPTRGRARRSRRSRRRRAEPSPTGPTRSPRRPPGLQMSLEEMSAATGVERERIKELEAFGIVCAHGPEGAQVLRRRRLHHLVDRQGLPALRHRAAAPHDVQAFRRARGLVLRGAGRADAAAEEPRCAP